MVRLEVCDIYYQAIRLVAFAGQRLEDAIENAKAAPSYEAGIQRLGKTTKRPASSRQRKAIADDEDDADRRP